MHQGRDRLDWALAGGCVAVAAVLAMLTVRLLLDLPWSVPLLLGIGLLSAVPFVVLGFVPSWSPAGRRVLRESIVAGGLVVFVCLIYSVLMVGLDRQARPAERSLVGLSMVAALAVAALAVPVRNRLVGFAEHLVPGMGVRPQEALDNLSTRMTRAVPMDELLLQLAESLQASTAPAGAEVWVASDEALVRTIAVPSLPQERLVLGADEQRVVARARVSGNTWAAMWAPSLLTGREDQVVRVAPISHLGNLLGLLVVRRPPGARAFTEDEESSLAELARHTGLALHNVRLDGALQASLEELRHRNAELQASRARIVAAADQSRRRIERDLHDGAQQHLVAMAVRIGLARTILEEDPEQVGPVLDEFRKEVQATLTELRALAHGIYPPLLRDRGLEEALRNACARSALPVEVDVQLEERPPADIEAAVYFCCLEAVNNAVKHAGNDASITLSVRVEGTSLTFDVIDSGMGFEMGHSAAGQGFDNMSDRLGAYGGELIVESSPGHGTSVRGRVPIGQTPTPEPSTTSAASESSAASEPADVPTVSELA
jgi:signal transduction histidine kinase